MYVGLKQPRGDGERYVTPARAAAKETTVGRVEKCSAAGAKTSSYRTFVRFTEKVVCRKCWCKLIKKTVIVKKRLLYLQYGYQAAVIIDKNHFNWLPSLVNFLVI